jgi:hypothetical protein
MRILSPLFAVVALVAAAMLAGQSQGLRMAFGVVLPYAAIAVFLAGVAWRVIRWSRAPVPFRIPSTCGQQKSLPWIKAGYLESPSSTLGVILRMALEILLFRSLFRNNRAELRPGPRLTFGEAKFLWLGAGVSLVVPHHFLWHLRFLEPVPGGWSGCKLSTASCRSAFQFCS